MNNTQKSTLRNIFHNPLKSDIDWREIEKVIVALGGSISEGAGSRVRVTLNGVRAVFHRPHPEKVTGKPMLRSVRRFLLNAGVTPSEL